MRNWQREKTVVFESDDWGGLERGVPNLDTKKKLARHPEVMRLAKSNARWRHRFYTVSDTLESVADMDVLFKLLAHYRGGDGRPAVFTPVCLQASPDYDAIRANGFTQYVDIGIDKPLPKLYQDRGDIIAKAREGIRMGVWAPESHNTRMAAHIDPHKWVRFLREKKDKALNVFFDHYMIGRQFDKFLNVGLEFDSMGLRELKKWVATGTRYFKKAYGYAPRVAGIADARSRCKVLEEVMEEIMVENGVKVITNAVNHGMGEYNRKLGLTYTHRNVCFEPLTEPADEIQNAWRKAYKEICRAWERNEPAIISTHRLHYVALNLKQKQMGLAQLERLLDTIHRKHPEAVYIASYELEGLYKRK